MVFYQLTIENSAPADTDRISDFLEELNALSISLTDKNDDPILEPEIGTTPLWPEIIITALFAEKSGAESAKRLLAENYSLNANLSFLEDEDWVARSLVDVKPQLFGEKLWVSPSWATPPNENAINLILDPGLAFGTGTHPTTRLCLEWLSSYPISDKNLLDYGCGSGILGLAALKLGAEALTAVDIDPQAIQATKANAENNQLSHKIHCLDAKKLSLEPIFDILISNILLSPLIELASNFRKLMKPKGVVVLTGILNEQVSTLKSHYQTFFEYKETHHLEDWSLLVFRA